MVRLTTIVLFVATIVGLSTASQSQGNAQAGAQAGAQSSVQAGKAQGSANVSGSSSASTQSDQANAGVTSGTAFNAALTTPMDSKKAKNGDSVKARTTEAVKSDGKVVLPKGTALVGHVTQASARAKGDSESALAIAFDRAVLKDGQEVPLNVAIQAIASAQSSASAVDSNMGEMDSMGASAAGSGMAAGRGGLGGITPTTGSAIGAVTNRGASVGSAAGGAVSSTANVASASRGAVGGVTAAGQLTSNSSGVFGMNGLSLASAGHSATQGSVITSVGKNVKLESGTRMLLVTQTGVAASPNR